MRIEGSPGGKGVEERPARCSEGVPAAVSVAVKGVEGRTYPGGSATCGVSQVTPNPCVALPPGNRSMAFRGCAWA